VPNKSRSRGVPPILLRDPPIYDLTWKLIILVKKKSRNYLLTGNHEQVSTTWQEDCRFAFSSGAFIALSAQLEIAPTTGHPHCQAFVRCSTSRTGEAVLKLFPHGYVFTPENPETVEWNAWNMYNYCIKPESRAPGCTPLELGTKPEEPSGRKGGEANSKRWELAKENAIAGRYSEIPADILIKHLPNLRQLSGLFQTDERRPIPDRLEHPFNHGRLPTLAAFPTHLDRTIKKRHLWLYAEKPNYGKSTWMAKIYREYRFCLKKGEQRVFDFWNEYNGEEGILLDEYNQANLSYASLNAICDGDSLVRIHGGSRRLQVGIVIVTSNMPIKEIYPFKFELLLARFREYDLSLYMDPFC